MQSAMISNRYILGIVAFSVSFGISLVPNWDLNQALITGVITILSTYAAALFTDKRRSKYEMLILTSHRKRIKEMEGLKLRIVKEINQIEEHRKLLYAESQKLEKQILDCRNQRDSLHRDLGIFAGQKKQLETESINLTAEIATLEQNQAELHHAFSQLTTEKRRLELNCNTSRAEIMQLQNKIGELQQEKQELESNVSLLGRLKPQLESKMYELRIETQELEAETNQQKELLVSTKTERENLAENLNYLENKITEKHSELQQIEAQVSLLQSERDLLQSQVWELLQQTETLNPEASPVNLNQDANDVFPFAELIDSLDSIDKYEILPEEWNNFLEVLPNAEIHVLKAIVEQDNPQVIIKQIAEANITMPNLLIDSINEHANDTIGELIIETNLENPQVYPEHIVNVRKMLAMYENLIARKASSN
ncbi:MULTISPECIES: tellurite resistance TerB C-terminal domain-containing protein [Cyanophyceae]|uniref:tellurite resistance TerB C-terminal domain-containing protein n=1 Tax=Cyanophyceae TaxID=3028117 RepID=UPI00232C9F11|nr:MULTISPECIES: tellurite resistance TerB C-terminal domain-containing protein [Cyanophyceae]MDB9357287.1 tellurite resistance TerB C-terminal domain-containing protein [Nodularia spumigena CS-587/03]MDB9339079.1 tellurite resistance TerB C-terminal domain-containing protein [Nodularia spumigena CS-589/07]MDB9401722.1 tellurite resistance TerB C-terminal domain-containing protein [Microcystis aeruginosa CS-567/02-A1]MDB9500940.1 tellurite resistance TerB C-terminal domain-containing protein [N